MLISHYQHLVAREGMTCGPEAALRFGHFASPTAENDPLADPHAIRA